MGTKRVNNWKSANRNRDTGCSDAGVNSCLLCPLPVCVEEMTTKELIAFRRRKQDGEVLVAVREERLVDLVRLRRDST